jgi:hypothetical protein
LEREHIEEARFAVMSDDDRDELIGFVRRQAEPIFYSPLPERPAHDSAPSEDPWGDIGYRRDV